MVLCGIIRHGGLLGCELLLLNLKMPNLFISPKGISTIRVSALQLLSENLGHYRSLSKNTALQGMMLWPGLRKKPDLKHRNTKRNSELKLYR